MLTKTQLRREWLTLILTSQSMMSRRKRNNTNYFRSSKLLVKERVRKKFTVLPKMKAMKKKKSGRMMIRTKKK